MKSQFMSCGLYAGFSQIANYLMLIYICWKLFGINLTFLHNSKLLLLDYLGGHWSIDVGYKGLNIRLCEGCISYDLWTGSSKNIE